MMMCWLPLKLGLFAKSVSVVDSLVRPLLGVVTVNKPELFDHGDALNIELLSLGLRLSSMDKNNSTSSESLDVE